MEEADGIKIYRTGHNTLQDRLYDLMNSSNRRNETQSVGSAGSGSGLFSGLVQRLADRTWRNNYWPDGSKLFLKPGIALGKQIIENESIDKIISVGLPYTCHLIARTLKESRPSVKWHMDIQDPFSYSKEFWVNNFDKYQKKNIYEERLGFAQADTISVTNLRAKEKYAELFLEQDHKVVVIPPLFHRNTPERYEMYLAENLIHLTYCGSFYTRVRPIEPFLKFLERLYELKPDVSALLQFHIVGQLDRKTRTMLDKYSSVRRLIVVHGFKNRAQTFSTMQQTDFLVNFGNTTDYHLPSKAVDFLYVSKPVVNFILNDNDSTKEFLEDKDVDVFNFNVAKEITEQDLKHFLDFATKRIITKESAIATITEYSVAALAKQYLA